jgi:uncharacterized protein (TIGR00369 family)
MTYVRNPFAHREGYNCFGCSPDNPIGLKLKFQQEGDDMIATWDPGEHYQGWTNILHGGIQATLIDEIGSWLVFVHLKTGGVTSRLEVKYRKPVPVNEGPIKLRATFDKIHSRIAVVDVFLYSPDGNLCAEGKASYYLFDKETARQKLMYPEDENAFVDPKL